MCFICSFINKKRCRTKITSRWRIPERHELHTYLISWRLLPPPLPLLSPRWQNAVGRTVQQISEDLLTLATETLNDERENYFSPEKKIIRNIWKKENMFAGITWGSWNLSRVSKESTRTPISTNKECSLQRSRVTVAYFSTLFHCQGSRNNL
jgi:hypothetical protein